MIRRFDRNGFVRYRTAIVGWVGVGLVAEWLTHAAPHSLLTLSDVEHFLGVALVGAGMALRSWAAGFLVKRDVLTTTGPYVCLRHPLYLGSLLLMLGFAELLEDRIALVAVVLLFALTHIPAMFKEERYMAARYGQQWVAYKSHTPAFFPIRRNGAGLNGWDRSLWRRSDEWACVSLSVLFMAVLQRASTL